MTARSRRFGPILLLGAGLCIGLACRDNPPPRRTEDGGRSGAGSAGSGGRSAGAGGSGGATGSGPAGASGDGGQGGSAGTSGPNVASVLLGSCATNTLRSELVPSNLLFVIDRSSSMACNPPPTTDSMECELAPTRAVLEEDSKWEIMTDALLNGIAALSEETVVGVSYFSNDDGCGVQSTPIVDLAPLSAAQRGAIQASLLNVEPRGATPLVGAVILAYGHMHKLALAGAIRGKKFVVLLTDGEQSDACSDTGRCADQAQCTQLLDDEATKAAGPGVGIRTFVIGAPGSEPARTVLSQLALSGGTAPQGCDPALGNCHFDMTTQERFMEALRQALTEISGRALTCELPIPRPEGGEIDPKRVNVVYTSSKGTASIVPQDARSDCDDPATNGWQYIEGETKIRLCGRICRTVREDHGAQIDVVHGCVVQGPF